MVNIKFIDSKFGAFAQQIKKFKENFVNCIYLSGVLSSANDENPLAVESRRHLDKGLGSGEDFRKMIDVSNSENVKIIVDCMARIATRNVLNKYKGHILKYMNKDNILIPFFGAKGRA